MDCICADKMRRALVEIANLTNSPVASRIAILTLESVEGVSVSDVGDVLVIDNETLQREPHDGMTELLTYDDPRCQGDRGI